MIPTPHCPLCGAQRGAPLISGRDMMTGQPGSWSFVQCSGCGLVRLHPRPADLAPFYPDDYESYTAHERRLRSPLAALARRYGSLKRARIVEQASGKRGGSLLDVGCASGAFLLEMRRRGWRVQGVEPGAAAAAAARSHGLTVHHGVLETAALMPGSLDALTLWDVLEHVPEPLTTLRAAAAALRPGGVALIRVPNPLGLDARLFGSY
jgi:SAM-dependent methyltransferase